MKSKCSINITSYIIHVTL